MIEPPKELKSKSINSYNGWKGKDIGLILLTKPCMQPKRSKRNWRWLHSAKDAAVMLGRSASSIKNQRIIYYENRGGL